MTTVRPSRMGHTESSSPDGQSFAASKLRSGSLWQMVQEEGGTSSNKCMGIFQKGPSALCHCKAKKLSRV